MATNGEIDRIVDGVQSLLRRTDTYFLLIESNRELMKQYLDLVSRDTLRVTNAGIARRIAERFNTRSSGTRAKKPVSKLIQSFSELEFEIA